MNHVAIIGHAATDPELRHTTGGRSVSSFRIAVNRPGSDGADFFTVVLWERQAEIASDYVAKGRRVAVEGRLHHSTWQTDGQTRSKVEIVATRLELLSPRPDTVASGPGPLSEERDLLDPEQAAQTVEGVIA
jgi:single-strand DNA-binding protein